MSRKLSLAFLSKGSSPMYKSKMDLHKSLLFTLPTWVPSTVKPQNKEATFSEAIYLRVGIGWIDRILLATLSTCPGSCVKSMMELLGILNSSLKRPVKLSDDKFKDDHKMLFIWQTEA